MKTTKIVLAVVFSIVCIGMSWGQQHKSKRLALGGGTAVEILF